MSGQDNHQMKTNRLIRILLLVLAVQAGLISCGQKNADYFPLDEGLYWRYNMRYEIMNGPDKSFFVVENRSPQKNGSDWLYEQTTMAGKSYFYQKVNDGIKLVQQSRHGDFEDETTEQDRYLLKFPLEKGATWQSETFSRVLIRIGPPQKTEFRIVALVPVRVEVESTTDTVKVEAGTFENCVRIRQTGTKFHNAGNYVGKTVVGVDETAWYAPDVGLIKLVRKESTTARALDHGEIVLELEQFKQN